MERTSLMAAQLEGLVMEDLPQTSSVIHCHCTHLNVFSIAKYIFFFPANNPRLIVYFSKFDFCFLGFLIDIHILSVRWWKMDVVSQVTSLVSEKMSKPLLSN
jgi:hypothetical protein